MKIAEIARQLRDESPAVKLKALKSLDEIQDFSGYHLDTLLELNEVLLGHREYFNPNVQMLALRVYDRVMAVLSQQMKDTPEAIARRAADSLIDDDKGDSPGESPAETLSAPLPPRRTPAARAEAAEDVTVDFRPVDQALENRPRRSSTPPGPVAPEPEPARTPPPPANPPAKEKKSRGTSGGMIIVYAAEETTMARIWNFSWAVLVFAVTLVLGYAEIEARSNAGYALLGYALLFVIALFAPSRLFPSYNKLRLGVAGFIGITAWLVASQGFQPDWGLAAHVPREFQSQTFFQHLNLNITRFVLLFWFLLPMYMLIVDPLPAAGTKFFVSLFFFWSCASLLESFILGTSIDTVVNEQGLFRSVPYAHLRPFLFGVNVYLPLMIILGLFALLHELFQFSLRRMLASLLLIAVALAPLSALLVHLRISPYPNVADFFWPRTLERYRDNLADGIWQSVMAIDNMESRTLDELAIEKSNISREDGTRAGTPREPEILIAEGGQDPAVSTNGLTMAWAQSDGKKSDIKFMRLQSREIVPLVSDNANNRCPVFSPDGSRIAFISDADGQDNVYLIHTNGRGLRQVTATTGKKNGLVWTREAIFYGSEGRIIRHPMLEQTDSVGGDLKQRIAVYQRIAAKVTGLPIQAFKSSLAENTVTIRYNTREGNEANIFREIYSLLVVAVKTFQGYQNQIAAFEIKARFLTTELVVRTIPEIASLYLADREYLTREKILFWLRASTITLDGRPYLTEIRQEGDESGLAPDTPATPVPAANSDGPAGNGMEEPTDGDDLFPDEGE